jgi:hypothetical protein
MTLVPCSSLTLGLGNRTSRFWNRSPQPLSSCSTIRRLEKGLGSYEPPSRCQRRHVLCPEIRQATHVDNDEIEREAQERLVAQLGYVRALEKRAESRGHWDLASPGSALASDDEVLRPFQLSHFIGHCLASSIDAMRTTRLVMQEHEGDRRLRLPLMGLYPTLRASSEAGALAIWMLQPEDSMERRLRALQARWEDVLHTDKAAQILFSDPLTGDKQGTSYQQAALKITRELFEPGRGNFGTSALA